MSFKFDPLPHDDAPPPEAEMPAKLAALGEQLQADAQHLGRVYPACRPPLELMAALEKSSQQQQYRRKWLLVVSSAAALVLVALTISLVRQTWPNPRLSTSPAVTHGRDLTEIRPTDLATAPATAMPSVQPVVYRPAVADVNGPELEGLLDLWNEQPQAVAAIAF